MIAIVPTTTADPLFEQVAALFDDYRVHHGRPASPVATRAWLAEQITSNRLDLAAALRNGRVCGFRTVLVTPASLQLGTVWSVRDLFVAPAHRRAGVASALLRHAVGEARRAGALRISLQTETGNAAALRLYTGLGFHRVTGLAVLNLPVDPD